MAHEDEYPRPSQTEPSVARTSASTLPVMKQPIDGEHDYTDGRKPWEWKSHYPDEARQQMRVEARWLMVMLVVFLFGAGACLGLTGQPMSLDVGGLELSISFRIIAIFFTGCVGGVTFSIKWLIHAIAKGKWHLDRQYWRLMVPIIGGVYACVVLTLLGSGFFANQVAEKSNAIASAAALAFLIGYFSDGVSGLLSNVANAVFGTFEKK